MEDVLAHYNIEASRYLSAAGVVMLIYDHILTFPDEVELVWKARWTTPKALFLILRYFVPPSLIIHLHQFSGISDTGLNDSFCKIWFGVSTVFAIMTMGMSNFLVILHLWNLWHRNKRLIYSTCLLYLITQVAHFVCVGIVISNLLKYLSYSQDLHCCIISDRGLFVLMWVPGLIFEIVICALVAYMSLRTPRDVTTRLSAALNRDGLIFYLILVFFRSINVILALKAPISLIFLCVFFICAAATTTVTRMILRLRGISVRRDSGNEKDGCSSLELEDASGEFEEETR